MGNKFYNVTQAIFNTTTCEREFFNFQVEETKFDGGEGLTGYIVNPIDGTRLANIFIDIDEIVAIVETDSHNLKTQKYNGWANRETWALHLHLSNDEDLYTLTTNACRRQGFDFFKEWVERMFATAHEAAGKSYLHTSEAVAMMVGEVGSLWRVDFMEVYNAFKE